MPTSHPTLFALQPTWLGLAMLLVSMAGCQWCATSPPVGELQQRILPPADFQPIDPQRGLDEAERILPAPRPVEEPAEEMLSGRMCLDCTSEPLTLELAIQLAYQNNPGLEAMVERIEQARAGRQIAFSDFLPQAGVSYRRIDGSLSPFALPTLPTAVGNTTFGGESDRFDLAELHLQWTLWEFGRRAARYGQASAMFDIANLQYARARQTVGFQVIAGYLAVLQARASRIVAEEAVRRAESVLRDARNFLKRGNAIRNDVYRAEVLVQEMKLGLVKSRTAESIAIAGLNQAIGINVSSPTQVVDRLEEPAFDLELAQCLQFAVDNRREFGVVLASISSTQLGQGAATAALLPRVTVGATRGHIVTPKEHDLLAGGVNIELDLFQGGKKLGQLRAADAELRGAIAQGREVCDKIAYEVNVAWLSTADARERIRLSRVAVTQARENLRVVRNLFEKGDATPTDMVDAELALTRAEQNYFTALYDYQTALARLGYAVGMDEIAP